MARNPKLVEMRFQATLALYHAISDAAVASDRSMAAIIRYALQAYLAAEREFESGWRKP